MADEKKLNFVAEDDVADCGLVITGGIEATLNHVRAYLESLENRETYTLVITRRDMTEKEIAATPVV